MSVILKFTRSLSKKFHKGCRLWFSAIGRMRRFYRKQRYNR